MTNSDMHNNLFKHAQLQNPVNKALNTKRNITQTPKETNWWSFDESLVWKTFSLSTFFVNTFCPTFSQNIKYCIECLHFCSV